MPQNGAVTLALEHYLNDFQPPADASVLVDATLWWADELFWPAFLGTVGGSPTAPRAFGAEPADVEEYADDLHDPDRWPYLTVALAQKHRLHFLFRNYDGDSGWDYLFQPAGSNQPWTLAALEGGFRGPGVSWPELRAAAGETHRAERLLMMIPALGDADLPPMAREEVAAAFIAVGGEPEQAETVAAELLAAASRFWGHVRWVDDAGLRVCLGDHSPRRYDQPNGHLALMTAAFS
jgi:hypothetical protein